MTDTDSLIEQLAKDAAAPQVVPSRKFLFPILFSVLLCICLLASTLGPPLASLPEIGPAPYSMKLAFALSVALLGTTSLYAAGKPGGRLNVHLTILSLPFLAVSALAALEAAAAAPDWPGDTWLRCVTAVLLLGLVAFAGMLMALRPLAPTRLRLTGALAGIAAGGIAASAYGLWCPETTALFLLSWYAMPVLVLGIAGALAGPRLLRW